MNLSIIRLLQESGYSGDKYWEKPGKGMIAASHEDVDRFLWHTVRARRAYDFKINSPDILKASQYIWEGCVIENVLSEFDQADRSENLASRMEVAHRVVIAGPYDQARKSMSWMRGEGKFGAMHSDILARRAEITVADYIIDETFNPREVTSISQLESQLKQRYVPFNAESFALQHKRMVFP